MICNLISPYFPGINIASSSNANSARPGYPSVRSLFTICILRGIRMSIGTMSFSDVSCDKIFAPENIFPWSHLFKMTRVHTGWIFTKMIDMITFSDFSFGPLVGNSVSFAGLPIESKLSVSGPGSFAKGCNPVPASPSLIHFDPKSFFGCHEKGDSIRCR